MSDENQLNKSNKDRKISINIPDGLKNPKYANTFRLGYNETEFVLDFGRMKVINEEEITGEENGQKSQVDVVSRIAIPNDIIKDLILGLFKLAREYEQEYNKDLNIFNDSKNQAEDH